MVIHESEVFDVSTDALWSLLAEFGAIEDWWPKEGDIQVERVVLEGEGIGMIRHIYNRGLTKPVSERLDFLDPETRTLILSIVGERMGGITAYVAIAHTVELAANSCRVDYKAYVTAHPGKEETVERNIRRTWQSMFAGLRSAATRGEEH